MPEQPERFTALLVSCREGSTEIADRAVAAMYNKLVITMRGPSARSTPGYMSRPVIATAIPPTAATIPATGNILLFEMK